MTRAATADELAMAERNLALGLANDHRTATPEQASEAFLALTSMQSHRGDGIPTQYVHGSEVAGHARVMWQALLAALRAHKPSEDMVERVACAIYGEDTLDGLGDVADKMRGVARAAIHAMENSDAG